MSKMRKINFLQHLRNGFITGVLVTAPLALTISLAWYVVNLFDTMVDHVLPPDYRLGRILPVYIPGIGLLIVGAALTMIGWFTAGFAGRWVVRLGEAVVARMPVIRGVHGALKQLFETILSNQSSAFRQVVLVQYPRHGCYTIAFVTAPTTGEVASVFDGRELLSLYVPTTPNPSSGFLLFVPREDVIPLKMSVDEAFKMVVSLGIIPPPEKNVNSVKN